MNREFHVYIKKIVSDFQIKGLIIGYPLVNNKPSHHCKYVEDFIKYLLEKQNLKIPVTFVNEEYSTIQARKTLELYQVQSKNYDPKFVLRKNV